MTRISKALKENHTKGVFETSILVKVGRTGSTESAALPLKIAYGANTRPLGLASALKQKGNKLGQQTQNRDEKESKGSNFTTFGGRGINPGCETTKRQRPRASFEKWVALVAKAPAFSKENNNKEVIWEKWVRKSLHFSRKERGIRVYLESKVRACFIIFLPSETSTLRFSFEVLLLKLNGLYPTHTK